MGLLDEAIREHLDLKRARGADPTEVERLEREALGPVRREPMMRDAPPGTQLHQSHGAFVAHGDNQNGAAYHEDAAQGWPDDGAYGEQLATDAPRPHVEAPEPKRKRRGFLRRSRSARAAETAPPPAEADADSWDQQGDARLDPGDPYPAQPQRPYFDQPPSPPEHAVEADNGHGPAPGGATTGYDSSAQAPLYDEGPATQLHPMPGHPGADAEHDQGSNYGAPYEQPSTNSQPAHQAPLAAEHHAQFHEPPSGADVTDPNAAQAANPPHLQLGHSPDDQASQQARPSAEPPANTSPPTGQAHDASEAQAEPPHPDELQRTTEFDVQANFENDADEAEDVLEETPEFLQDAPEHDRLWFEQRPPQDFDFGG